MSVDNDMRGFVRHTAWLAAPTATIDIGDTIVVTFCNGLSDVEIDPSGQLSIGFSVEPEGERYFLTSLCLDPRTLWGGTDREARMAVQLLGETVSKAVGKRLGIPGQSRVSLTKKEATELITSWSAFARVNAD
jgi:hypothetical protein